MAIFLRNTGFGLLCSVVIIACGGGGGGGGGSNTVADGVQSASVGVVITDNSIDDYDQALATISSIELLGEDGKVDLYDGPPVTVDLLDLRDYQELFAINDDVPPGTYSKIRLWLDNFELVELNDMGDVVESTPVRLVANGKVDLNPRGSFDIEAGDSLFITLDFDLDKSVKLTFGGKNKKPKLRPVIFVHISDREPLGRIARVRGVIDEIDEANQRFRLCEVERVSQVTIPTPANVIDECLLITTGERTAYFNDKGVPKELADLAVDDPVTIVGRLVLADEPLDFGTVVQPLAAMGLDDSDDDWDGHWDLDHDWGTDCTSSVNPKPRKKKKSNSGSIDSDTRDSDSSDSDGCGNDGIGQRFGLAALIVEQGPAGSWRIWRGETASEVVAGRFDLQLDSGQGFADGEIVTARVWETTRIVSFSGELLDKQDIEPGQNATLDGVFATTSDELRAAFIALDLQADVDPQTDEVRGEVVGIDPVGESLTLSTDKGQVSVNAVDAPVVFVQITDDGIESKSGSLGDIEVGEEVLAFGEEGDSCFEAKVIIVNVKSD